MGFKRRTKVDSGFSMSSMTDIVFLLLVFFMITSTLVTPFAKNDIDLPKSDHQVSAKPSTTISVTKDLHYYVEGEEVPFSQIEPRLKSIIREQPEIYIALHVDQRQPFQEPLGVSQ